LEGGLAVAKPVQALHEVSHDASLRHRVGLADGRTITALQLQWEYHRQAVRFVEQGSYDGEDPVADQTKDVLEVWESVLSRLESDPMQCKDELDWVAKLDLLESYRERDGLDWDHAKLHLVDLQYADIRPEKGLYHRLVRGGRMKRLLDDDAIDRAVTAPPEDTRAYFRGTCLARYPESVAAASWDSVILDLPGRDSLQRIPTMEPLRGTREHVGALFDDNDTAVSLFDAITSR
ncbi:MAG: proteasome accessory factor PafA2 family protein, partial [Nocardioidaceae bacterium]